MSRKQQSITTTLTSIDKSAGEQGPPNRIAPQVDLLTAQIKSEPINNHYSNLTTTSAVSLNKPRISTDAISRLAIHNNNSNARADTNGSHFDIGHVKTEEILFNHDAKIQVRF
jgi:hypothetical protein